MNLIVFHSAKAMQYVLSLVVEMKWNVSHVFNVKYAEIMRQEISEVNGKAASNDLIEIIQCSDTLLEADLPKPRKATNLDVVFKRSLLPNMREEMSIFRTRHYYHIKLVKFPLFTYILSFATEISLTTYASYELSKCRTSHGNQPKAWKRWTEEII